MIPHFILAPRKISTRRNPQSTPVAPVPDPEKILRRGKYLPYDISKLKGNSYSKSSKSYLKNTESSSSKIVGEKSSVAEIAETVREIISATQPTVSTIEDVFVEEFIGSNTEQPSPFHKKSTSDSSADSIDSQREEKPFDTYTSQLVVENLLTELFVQGEETLAK